MSAQGAILQRRQMHLPMVWPVVALLVITVAVGIGVRVLDDPRPAEPATSIQETEGYWAPTVGHPTAPRQGAVAPVLIGAEASGITFATGLENPGVYGTDAPASSAAELGYGDCIHCQQRR